MEQLQQEIQSLGDERVSAWLPRVTVCGEDVVEEYNITICVYITDRWTWRSTENYKHKIEWELVWNKRMC